ncbi:MAG TPA: hypothetical protein VFA90_01185 [Terriglobales bacterium]|nr:hypothetical protein [Terriglobales bacterium]
MRVRSLFPVVTIVTPVWIITFISILGLPVAAQPPNQSSVETQRDAMSKLSFLVGQWSGPVTIAHGQGEPLHLRQTEDVEYKLDGLVLLIEGKSTSADGKVVFSALATLAYDDASHAYHFRAYNDGHYLDTDLSVRDRGFSWSFTAGPAHISNTMHLTDKGEWNEVTEVIYGNNAPHRSVEMLLQKQP